MTLLAQIWPLAAFVAGAIVVVALAMLPLRDGPPPYQRRGTILSPAEVGFLHALRAAIGDDWVLLAKVPLADVIQVRPKTRQSQTWHSRMQGKHLDYVLCDYETLEAKLAIVLEQAPQSRKVRERFVVLALSAAGLPLLRVRVHEKSEPAALRKGIEEALGIGRKKKRA